MELTKNYVIIEKKDIIDFILDKNIFTPFVNIENNMNLEKSFNNFLENKQKNEIHINLENCNNDFLNEYTTKQTWHQFDVDIVRSNFYIDNKRIKEPNEARKIIENKFNKKNSEKIALLCTQGSLAFIIKSIQFPIIDKNYIIAEVKSSNKKMDININLENSSIIIIKNLRVAYITKLGLDTTIITFLLTVEYTINNEFVKSNIKIKNIV